jgi:hypothetical protein
LKHILTKGGRDKELVKDKFLFSNIDENTSLIVIDDCNKYFEFNHFYSQITGDMSSRKMHQHEQNIEYTVSPKMVFTSNFTPLNFDSSTARRFQFVIFSDWYHEKTDLNNYRESRKVCDDFGYDIIENPKYTDEWKNEDVNFLLDCLHYYLAVVEHNGKINPPMKKFFERINESEMGDHFAEWAEQYFENTPENTRINQEVSIITVYNEFIGDAGVNTKDWSKKRFNKALLAFCKNKQYELEKSSRWETGKSQRTYIVKTEKTTAFVP